MDITHFVMSSQTTYLWCATFYAHGPIIMDVTHVCCFTIPFHFICALMRCHNGLPKGQYCMIYLLHDILNIDKYFIYINNHQYDHLSNVKKLEYT
jgi:hypothetical protein